MPSRDESWASSANPTVGRTNGRKCIFRLQGMAGTGRSKSTVSRTVANDPTNRCSMQVSPLHKASKINISLFTTFIQQLLTTIAGLTPWRRKQCNMTLRFPTKTGPNIGGNMLHFRSPYLFILAAILCRFVGDKMWTQEKRLVYLFITETGLKTV